MKLSTITLLAGLALGMLGGSAAWATGKPTCNAKTDWSKPCTDPANETNWTFNNKAEADAWAAANASSSATGVGVGIGTGGDASSSATGGSVVYNEAKPNKVSYGVTVGIVIDPAELLDGPNKRANRTAMSYGALGDNGTGLAVLDSTFWGRRALKTIEESGGALCQMTKDGVLQVNRYTNIAQCKAYHGVN